MEERITININSIKSLFVSVYFNDVQLGTATGFIVNENNILYLVTNRHVVTGRNNETGECLDTNLSIPNKLKLWFPHQENNNYIWSNIDILLFDENENKIWLEHPTYKEKVDVVVIRLGQYDQIQFCHNLISNYKPVVTENVYIIGYPFGFNVSSENGKYAIWSTGTVASDPDLNLNINGEQLPAFLVDAKTRHGQSGSPVIYYNKNGIDSDANGIALYGGPVTHEIGIYSGRINKESDLGYVWKWSLIKEIIDNN